MDEDRSSKFSPSKIDVYKNCARKYHYRYVDHILRKRKTPETVVGTAVHAAFEQLYELVSGGKVPTLAEVLAFYDKSWEHEWDEEVQVKDGRFSPENWKKVGADCIEFYYGAHAPFSEDRTVAIEKKVGFPLMVEGCEYRIEGFIDRLSIASDGAIEIHDYKTAKSLPTQEHIEADWQLGLYELAVRHDWPDVKGVRLKWHYVRHGVTLTSVRDADARERLSQEVAENIAAIKRDREFKTNKGPLCDWCEYRDICPEFAHGVKVAQLAPEQRRHDDGVRLVDELAQVEAKRRRLKGELRTLELEKDDLDSRIAEFADHSSVTTVFGTSTEASVLYKEEVRFPTKTSEPERHAALENEARKTSLWADISRLDVHALAEGARLKRWSGQLLDAAKSLIERYGLRETFRTVRLKRRRDIDDEE